MEGLLRKLMIWICCPIYKLIPTIYGVFYKLANHRFFEDDTIDRLSSNIYVLVSVVMLFAFSANLIAAIVNPDLLNDKKKGAGALFKRSIIGLILMILVPFIFDKAYDVQKEVMDKSLIEKVLVGIRYSDEENKGGNGGQVIAGTLISSVLYPIDDDIEISENISEDYADMVSKDIGKITKVAKHINIAPENSNEEYAFEFESIVALIGGGFCCYLLLVFAFDMAVRTIKLAFLELTAPISLVAYIASGNDFLKRWSGEVGKTFLDVFMRIACMAFYIFILGNINQFLERVDGGWFVKVLLIVGVLIFVKQLPDFINGLFGTNIKLKGGIGGRLGEMAAVGGIAQKAWQGVKNVAGLAATGVAIAASGPLGWAATGAVVGGSQLWRTKLKDTKFGQGVTAAGKTAGAFLRSNNALSGIMSARKEYEGTDYASERKYQKEQNRLSNLKTNAKANAHSLANKVVPGLYDANGDIVSSQAANADISKILDNSKISKFQQDAINKLDKARHEKRSAENNLNAANRTVQLLERLREGTNDGNLKTELNGIISAYESGNLDAIGLEAKLDSAGITGTVASEIVNNAKLVKKGNAVSIKELTDELEQKTNSFDTAKTSYDKMIDSIKSDTEKEQLKAYAKVGDDISKVKIKDAYKTQYTSSGPQNHATSSSNNSSQQNNNIQGLNIDFDSENEYAQQYSNDDFDIHSSGNFKLKDDE